MAEGTYVSELEEGALVEATFAVQRKRRRRTRNGDAFLSLELADRTGRVPAVVWNDVNVLGARFDEGDTVRVLGRVESYDGRPQIAIRDVERLEQGDALELVPGARRDAETLDGMVEGTGAVFEAKFMLPWSFSEEAAAEKHMAQLQHNMWVTNATAAVLSIITGGGKWVEIKIPADSLYQHLLLTAEKKFWRCVESGERPRVFGVEPPRARIEAVRIVDMSASNAWAEFSGVFQRTREAHLEHENAKAELKGLMPEDVKEAIGHGIRARRSKSGAVSFDVLSAEGGSHAPL